MGHNDKHYSNDKYKGNPQVNIQWRIAKQINTITNRKKAFSQSQDQVEFGI